MTPDLPPIDPGEAALATIGITPIISGEMPRVGVEKTREILGLGKRIQLAARELAQGHVVKPKIARPHSYRKLLDRLSRGLSPDEIQGLVDKFAPEASHVSGPFVLAVQQCMDHLKAIFPTSEYVTFTGPKELTPPEDKVFGFFLQYQVIDNPLAVIGLMTTASLLHAQVDAVKKFFPTVAAAITAAVPGAVTAEKAAHGEAYRLRYPAEMGLKRWLGQRTVDFQPVPAGRILPQSRTPNPNATKPIAEADQPAAQQNLP